MPPRPPLIVTGPSALQLVLAQVRREAQVKMNADNRGGLRTFIVKFTRDLVPDVQFTDRSTKNKLELLAKVGHDTLFLVQTKAERLNFAAGDTIEEPFVIHNRIRSVNPLVDQTLRKLIKARLPRIRDNQALNNGLPKRTRAHRDDKGIHFIIEDLSDEGFQRVVEALRPHIDRDRFNREDPI